jgi:hypothetical protein
MSDFIEGEIVYGVGRDMRCKKVLTQLTFVRDYPDGRIVVRSQKINVIVAANSVFKNKEDARKIVNS